MESRHWWLRWSKKYSRDLMTRELILVSKTGYEELGEGVEGAWK